jgi:hypothetical protein
MRRLTFGAVFGVALLAACGGGGGGGTSTAPGPLPPAPTQTATAAPGTFTSSNAVAIPNASPGATTVPVALSSDATGASANAALPAAANVSTDTTIAVTYTSTADSSIPALSALRSTQGRHVSDETKGNALAYLKLQFSADLNLPQAPGFTFTVPGTITTQGVAYWLAFYDPLRAAAGWQKGFEGPATVTPATVNGKTVTQFVFPSNGKPLSFVANQTYWFAVIAVVTTAASPTPVPSTVPSNAPPSGRPAPVVATPKNVQFAAVTDTPAPVTFSQTGFAGTFELHGNCTGIVNTTGASPTWTITPVGPGRCVIVALGDRGSSAVVHVGVVTPFETPHPNPSRSPEPSQSPEPSHSPESSPSPGASRSPEPSRSPTASPSANPSGTPAATSSPSSSPSVTPTPLSSPGK